MSDALDIQPNHNSQQMGNVPTKDAPAKSKDSLAEGETLPVKEKAAYGLGSFCNQFGEAGINSLATPVYNISLGLSPAIIGIVMGAMRFWDAVSDPIMGTISDNWKGKNGRRRPFILIGALLMAFSFPLLWFASPSWADSAKTIYFVSACIFFFTTYTIFSVPFRALGTELTADYKERTAVSIYSAYMNKFFQIGVVWILPLSQMDFFGDPVTGIRAVTGACSVLILIAGFSVYKYTQERYYKVAKKQEKVNLFKSFKEFSKDRCFITLHSLGLGLLCSTALLGALGLYVNLFFVWGGDLKAGYKYAAIGGNITQFLGFFFLWALKRYWMNIEKKKILTVCVLFGLSGSAAKWFLFTPENPYLTLIIPIFFAPAYTGLWAIFMSMLADYTDYDEHKNGNRREGIFGAVSGWVMKAGASLSIALSGILLTMTNFDKDLGGTQTESTFLAMRLLFIILPAACFILTYIMIQIYPLTKEKMTEIRNELEIRRGKV